MNALLPALDPCIDFTPEFGSEKTTKGTAMRLAVVFEVLELSTSRE